MRAVTFACGYCGKPLDHADEAEAHVATCNVAWWRWWPHKHPWDLALIAYCLGVIAELLS